MSPASENVHSFSGLVRLVPAKAFTCDSGLCTKSPAAPLLPAWPNFALQTLKLRRHRMRLHRQRTCSGDPQGFQILSLRLEPKA